MPRRRKILPHRRVREKKTNYRKRLNLLKSGKPRLVVRRANKNILCQIIKFDKKGDITVVSSSSSELKNFGWNVNTGNIPSAYLTGFLCAVRAKEAKIKEAMMDTGFFEGLRGSRMFSALKGAVDGGLDVPHSEEAFPPEDRLNGTHIANYAAELKKSKKEFYEKYFSAYLKVKADPEALPKLFEATKAKIEKEGAKSKLAPKNKAEHKKTEAKKKPKTKE